MRDLIERVCKSVVGRKNEILMIISALFAKKHIFLEGAPGTSKSTMLHSISECTDIEYILVTGNGDLTTSKLIGYFDPAETLSKGYKPEYFIMGPLIKAMKTGMYLYIEEFNRLPDETTNVFVTVMSENKIAVPRLGLVEAHPNFRIIAALNPLDDIGINRISRALKDRFTSIKIDYQSREEEINIVRKKSKNTTDDIIELAVDISRKTRQHSEIKLGSSIRGSIDMVDIFSQIVEIIDKKEQEFDNYLLLSAQMAFRNKIWLYETGERSAEEIISEIFNQLQLQKKK
jgi:MoxR-like ATPase